MGSWQSDVDEKPGDIGGSSNSDKIGWFCSREKEKLSVFIPISPPWVKAILMEPNYIDVL